MLKRRIARDVAQATFQEQCLGFAQIPQRCLHRIAPQALQRAKPLVAVDDHVPIRCLAVANDDDRLLLAVGLKRDEQATLTLGVEHPQRLVPSLQLVKLKLHGNSCRRGEARQGTGRHRLRHHRAWTEIASLAIWS